jgi:hypothetical protein
MILTINITGHDIDYDILVHTYDSIHDIIYDLTSDIIGLCSICSAAALCRPSCSSGLAATLPRLCRPGPALAEPPGTDPLRLGDRHHLGAAPATAPHPEVWMVKNHLYQVFQLSSVGSVD